MLALEQASQSISLAELPFSTVVEARPDEEAARSCAEAWVDDGPERFKSQLDELALLYRGRSIRETYHWGGKTDEFRSFLTRTSNGEEPEEIYTIYDQFSPALKGYQERTYCATVLASDTSDGYRIIARGNELEVREPDETGKESIVRDEERAKELLEDFFHRSLIATIRETSRDGEVQMAADMDALTKLIDRSYEGQYQRERRAAQAWLDAYNADDSEAVELVA